MKNWRVRPCHVKDTLGNCAYECKQEMSELAMINVKYSLDFWSRMGFVHSSPTAGRIRTGVKLQGDEGLSVGWARMESTLHQFLMPTLLSFKWSCSEAQEECSRTVCVGYSCPLYESLSLRQVLVSSLTCTCFSEIIVHPFRLHLCTWRCYMPLALPRKLACHTVYWSLTATLFISSYSFFLDWKSQFLCDDIIQKASVLPVGVAPFCSSSRSQPLFYLN